MAAEAAGSALPPQLDVPGPCEEAVAAVEADGAEDAVPVRAKRQRPCYRYGNYEAYYGYRAGAAREDHRLLSLRREWFEGRRCLDVGCNEGLVSLTLAVQFRTASFTGVDIDASLVRRAQKSLRRLQRSAAEAAAEASAQAPGESLPSERTQLAAAAGALAGSSYRCGNILEVELPCGGLDTILVLSVTKWVHLNWGDAGLRRLFARAFQLLAPGGLLVLEPQPWKSYGQAFRKQRMPEETRVHYRAITLRPKDFAAYLLGTVGFARVEELRGGSNAGFDRPLLLCYKDHAPASVAPAHAHDSAPGFPGRF